VHGSGGAAIKAALIHDKPVLVNNFMEKQRQISPLQ